MAAVFDTLPDEILLEILTHFALRPKSDVFFPEFYLKGIPRSSAEKAEFQAARSKHAPIDIHYLHSATTKQCRRGPSGRPDVHCAEWLVLNTTCRRIRRLGKGVFFQTRCLAMSSTLPQRLQQRSFIPALSTTDQELALARIEDVVFVDGNVHSPSDLLSLPRRLALFPRLRSCLVVYGYRESETLGELKRYVAFAFDGELDGRRNLGIPPSLRKLLCDIGVPEDIHVDFAFPPGLDSQAYRNEILRISAPMLHQKAQALGARPKATVSGRR